MGFPEAPSSCVVIPSTYKSLGASCLQCEGDGGPQLGRLWSWPSFIFLSCFTTGSQALMI